MVAVFLGFANFAPSITMRIAMEKKFDVLIIGAGPGGYVAALQAARRNASVALIEREYLGGTCLNWGCIPTKTLIASGDVLHLAQHAAEFGVRIGGKVAADWAAMQQRKDGVVGKLREGIAGLLKASGVMTFTGEASFLSRNTVRCTPSKGAAVTLCADKIIVATGAAPAMPGFLPKSPRVLDSTAALALAEIPKRLLVLGGGVIGCEFACLFARLGTAVTVVELLPEILPMVDMEIARLARREMKALGITVLTGQPLKEIAASAKGVTATVAGETLGADYLLAAVGRVPVTVGLNLAAAGLTPDDHGFLRVDDACRTGVPGVYAIGDVTGRIQLAHMASAMGMTAADHATGDTRARFRDDLVPNCIFTAPEIGTLGLTAEQCREQGREVRVGKFPFAALGKAMAIGETAGFVKIITDAKTDQVLGIHIIGPHATDLIAEAAPALNLEITAHELARAIHAHPTLGEAVMEAAHAVHGKALHLPPPRK
jgi:dihydrolipoamide dehydrogenase